MRSRCSSARATVLPASSGEWLPFPSCVVRRRRRPPLLPPSLPVHLSTRPAARTVRPLRPLRYVRRRSLSLSGSLARSFVSSLTRSLARSSTSVRVDGALDGALDGEGEGEGEGVAELNRHDSATASDSNLPFHDVLST